MSRAHTGRLVALASLLALALAGVAEFAWTTVRDGWRAPVVRLDDRYRDLLLHVPERAVLGYVSDLPRDLGDGDYRFYERYYQAQYAVAPRLLIDSTDEALVLADLSDPASAAAIAARLGRQVVRASASGHVVLLARTETAP